MKKILFSALAVAMGLKANAESDMYLQMDDQNDLSYVKVSLIVENDLEKYIEGLDAHILLPNPLTKENFVEDVVEEELFVYESAGSSQNKVGKIDNTNGTLWVSLTTNSRNKKNGHVQGGPGKIDLGYFHFNASSLETGDYELLINSNDPAYNSFVSVTDMVDGAYGTTYHTEILGHKSSLKFHVDKTAGTIKAVAAPITAPVTIFKAGASIDVGPDYTNNASYDITTEYTPVENSLLITDDANGKNIPGNNVVYFDSEDGLYHCKNLVINDAYGFYSPVNFTAENVTYNRSIDPGKDYITICLPFAVSKENLIGGQPGALAGLVGTDLTFSGVTTTVAYQPYLLKINGQSGAVVADAGLTNVAIVATPDPSDDDMSNVKGGVTHYGQMSFYDYNHEVAPETDFYAFAAIDNRFHRVKLLHVPAFRTVIWLGHSDAGVGLKSTDMSSLGIKFIDGDVPTGAEVVEAEAGKVNVFDPLGRAVRLNVEADKATEGLKDGIYIVNGQKVIVKNK